MGNDEQPRDHESVDNEPVDKEPNAASAEATVDIQENMKSRSTWLRLLFMLCVFALYFVSRFVVLAVIVGQFLWVLFTAETNKQLSALGHSLALFVAESIDFLTYNSEKKPFRFDNEWPSGVNPQEQVLQAPE